MLTGIKTYADYAFVTFFFPVQTHLATSSADPQPLGSFTHGSMANALPQAIGAQVSHPGRQVISLSGDGGLAMLMGDLLSLRQLKLPVKLIVFNNSSLAFVELEMKAAGILYLAPVRATRFCKDVRGGWDHWTRG